MPAVIARSILPMSGLSSSRQASDSAPPERSSSATSAPRSRWASTSALSMSRSGERSGRISSRQMRPGSPPRRIDDRPGRAHRGLDVEDRARVDVDEQDLALGHQREPDLERGGAGAGIEGEQRVVGLGGGDQLGAAQLDLAHLAAHQRLAAVGLPLARSMIGWKCGAISPWERNSGNQSVRARSSSVSAGIGRPCSSSSLTANRQARSEWEIEPSRSFRRSSQPGPGEHAAPRWRCRPRPARSRGARACRARTVGATGVARRQRSRWPPVRGSPRQHRRERNTP